MLNLSKISVTMQVSKVRVLGLSNFQIKSVNMSVSELKLSMEIAHPYLGFAGDHLTKGKLGTTEMSGGGQFKAEARNIAVGVSIEFTAIPFGIKSHNVSTAVGSMQASFSGFGTRRRDRQFNRNMKFGTPSWVQENQKKINDEMNTAFVDFVNERLAGMLNLDNVVAAVKGFRADDCFDKKDDYEKTMEEIEIIEEEGVDNNLDLVTLNLESTIARSK